MLPLPLTRQWPKLCINIKFPRSFAHRYESAVVSNSKAFGARVFTTTVEMIEFFWSRKIFHQYCQLQKRIIYWVVNDLIEEEGLIKIVKSYSDQRNFNTIYDLFVGLKIY